MGVSSANSDLQNISEKGVLSIAVLKVINQVSTTFLCISAYTTHEMGAYIILIKLAKTERRKILHDKSWKVFSYGIY